MKDWTYGCGEGETSKNQLLKNRLVGTPLTGRKDDASAEIADQLLKNFPYGHPSFIPLTIDEVKLHSEKNYDYAQGGDPLGNFKRVGNILRQYPDLNASDPAVVAVIYALKQLDAWLWMKCQNYEGVVEGRDARLRDIHVYIKLARILEKEQK